MDVYTFIAGIPLLFVLGVAVLSGVFYIVEEASNVRYRKEVRRHNREHEKRMRPIRAARAERQIEGPLEAYLTDEERKVWAEYEQAKRDGLIE